MSRLPQMLKEDFKHLGRLEGQYRVTGFLTEDFEDLSPEKGQPCDFYNVKDLAIYWTEFVEDFKPTITFPR